MLEDADLNTQRRKREPLLVIGQSLDIGSDLRSWYFPLTDGAGTLLPFSQKDGR
jgi:hypothetical protein